MVNKGSLIWCNWRTAGAARQGSQQTHRRPGSKTFSPIMLSFRECGFRASNQGASEAASHHQLHGSRVMASSCTAETGVLMLIGGD